MSVPKAGLFWYSSQVVSTPSTVPIETPSTATKVLSPCTARRTVRAWKPSARSTAMVRLRSRTDLTITTPSPATPTKRPSAR